LTALLDVDGEAVEGDDPSIMGVFKNREKRSWFGIGESDLRSVSGVAVVGKKADGEEG